MGTFLHFLGLRDLSIEIPFPAIHVAGISEDEMGQCVILKQQKDLIRSEVEKRKEMKSDYSTVLITKGVDDDSWRCRSAP